MSQEKREFSAADYAVQACKFYQNMNYDLAIQASDIAIELDFFCAAAYMVKGRALGAMGQYSDAINNLNTSSLINEGLKQILAPEIQKYEDILFLEGVNFDVSTPTLMGDVRDSSAMKTDSDSDG